MQFLQLSEATLTPDCSMMGFSIQEMPCSLLSRLFKLAWCIAVGFSWQRYGPSPYHGYGHARSPVLCGTSLGLRAEGRRISMSVWSWKHRSTLWTLGGLPFRIGGVRLDTIETDTTAIGNGTGSRTRIKRRVGLVGVVHRELAQATIQLAHLGNRSCFRSWRSRLEAVAMLVRQYLFRQKLGNPLASEVCVPRPTQP